MRAFSPLARKPLPLLILGAVLAVATALMISASTADAGYYLRVFCPTSGTTNPPASYAGSQDPWAAGAAGSGGQQSPVGSYPGLQNVTMWTDASSNFTQISSVSNQNSWYYKNGCSNLTTNSLGITGEADRYMAGSSAGKIFNQNREVAMWWRFAAPIGNPSLTGASEDVGMRWLVTRYQAQIGVGNITLGPMVRLGLGKLGNSTDQDMVMANPRHSEYGTGINSSSTWRRLVWDSGALVNEGPAPTGSGSVGVTPGNDGNAIGQWSGNDFSGVLAHDMILKATCVNTPDALNYSWSAGCSNLDTDRATIGSLRDTRFVIQDSEAPTFNITGTLLSGWRNGSSTLSAQSMDDGGGVDLSITQAMDPNTSTAYSTLDTRYGACRYWNSNAPVSNGNAANRASGTWNVYSTQLAHYGGSFLYDTGPCDSQVTYSGTINAASALRQGLSQIRTCATDYDESGNSENPTDYTVGSTVYTSLYNSDSANLSCGSQNAFVDSVSPPTTAPAVSGPLVYDPQWMRGSVTIDGSSADTTRGPDGIAGNADDANSFLGTPMISVSAQTGFQWSVNSGAWANYGTWNSTAPSSPDGTQADSESLDTTLLANGASVDLRTVAFDNAFNINVSATTAKKVDNQNPTDTTTEPVSGTGYSSFPVTVKGTDADSHVYSVNWVLLDSKGTPATGDDTTVQSGSKTVASVADDSDSISDTVVINNDNYYVLSWVVDQAGNTSGFKTTDPLIDLTAPTLAVGGGSSGWYNTDRTITYTAQDADSGVSSIDWSVLSGSRPASVPASKSFTCASNPCGLSPATMVRTDTFTDEQDLQFSATATDTANNVSSPPRTYQVRIDKTPPNLAVTAPSDGSTPAGPGVELTATSNDPNLATGDAASGPATGVFEICALGGGVDCTNSSDWEEIDQVTAIDGVDPPLCRDSLSPSGGTYDCNLDSSQYGNGDYKLRFKGYDIAGNWARSPEISFAIDNADICPVP